MRNFNIELKTYFMLIVLSLFLSCSGSSNAEDFKEAFEEKNNDSSNSFVDINTPKPLLNTIDIVN